MAAKSSHPRSLFPEPHGDSSVECFGATFPNDEARRLYFTEKLREKLKDTRFRKTEGFPIGDDDDILEMSDPPYYSACPNPFIADFVTSCGRPLGSNDKYHREPLAVDSSEGKTDSIYTAHSYHTKVPHQAIMRAILHYTLPGDVVLDGFAGSGMTGVAAQLCGDPEPEFRSLVEAECQDDGRQKPQWGARRVVLNDLSPAATFICRGYNLPFDVKKFATAAQRLLQEVCDELDWMYETTHSDGRTKGRINFTVWSENFSCPECGKEFVFHKEALDSETNKVRDVFPCPTCGVDLTKDRLQRVMETQADPVTGIPWHKVKFTPVLINYSIGERKYEKTPDGNDLELLARVARLPLPTSIPTDEFPIERMYHGSRLGCQKDLRGCTIFTCHDQHTASGCYGQRHQR